MVKIKVAPFLWPTVYIISVELHCIAVASGIGMALRAWQGR